MNIGKLIRIIKNPGIAKTLLSFYEYGYLYEVGWFKSYSNKKPVDSQDRPIPWVTYSFIDFITGRLNKTMSLLEYGSGNSTLFYGERVKKVVAVENDLEWFNMISKSMPSNVEMKYIELVRGADYCKYGSQFPGAFDIVIVDGRDRVNCLKNSIGALSDRGVMVLDDSERGEYQDGTRFMLDKGFKKIDFWGVAPGVFNRKSTTVFYRPGNCLDI
jgi:hypothetical protein